MSKAVGIDLGTTNSLVAIVEDGRPRVIARGDERLVPSVVGLDDEGKIIVGQVALNQYVVVPERTIRSIKRKMGTDEKVRLGDQEYLPEEISSFILRHLKSMAEQALGETVDRAVITVPAYFNDAQRQATRRAGELAGFEVQRIINEPTAAALAYGLEKQSTQFLLVYDLGGGTFDVSVIEQQEDILEVRASHGNVRLGGDDFDERLLQSLLTHLSSEHRHDFREDRRVMARLSRAAERVKIALSSQPFAQASEEYLTRYEGQIAHLNTEISRQQFEEMIQDLLKSTLDSIDKALADAGLKADQIQRVLLVGGSTRIPRVGDMIRHHIGLEPAQEINPDEAVALGAAVQAAIIGGEQVNAMLVDVSPHSLGIATAAPVFGNLVSGIFAPIIRRNTTIPTTRAELFHTLTPEQDEVEIKVYQGEMPMASENTHLVSFKLSGIPPGPDPDMPREVVVEFSYNLDGVVEVCARDHQGTRREMATVNTATAKRASSEPELPSKFSPEIESDIRRTLETARKVELQLTSDGKTKELDDLRAAREKLEAAHRGKNEKNVRDALAYLDDVLYELED
ncbi:MAG: Hsp70 family protein [Blastocatellia bacterium]